jgi:hypothetical protein
MKLNLFFKVNNSNQNQVNFCGKIREYNENDYIATFKDGCFFAIDADLYNEKTPSFMSINVSAFYKKKIIYLFDIHFNDVVVNLDKDVCFGELHTYFINIIRNTSQKQVRESKLINEDDFQKKFYTSISYDEKLKRIVFNNFSVVFPQKILDNYYVYS